MALSSLFLHLRAWRLQRRGWRLRNAGDAAAALPTFLDALQRTRAAGGKGEAVVLHGLGTVYMNLGQVNEAAKQFDQMLTIAREDDNRDFEATALHNLGAVLQIKGRSDEALARYKEALALRRELGDADGEVRTLTNIQTIEGRSST